jgi:WD40 repeat protein
MVSNAHHADVYGLSIHPARPFLMVSASRDTTLRLWDLASWLAGSIWSQAAVEGELPVGEVIGIWQLCYGISWIVIMVGEVGTQPRV